jgi:POT family proton-dependent oligopeptide transporter
MAELCISPVGLCKLVPARMIAFMFGVGGSCSNRYERTGMFGENIDKIANEHGLSYFFGC